jgi:hypothetical protein
VRAADRAGALVSERPTTLPDGDEGAFEETGGSGDRARRPAHALTQETWALTDSAILIALVAIGVAVPAAVALWSHSFGIPRYDDWAYRRVLSDFVQTGHFTFVGWGAMTLVGQVLWAAPFAIVFGGHPWVAGFSVAVASAIGIGCAYWLARAIVGRVWGAACTLLVLACAGFLVNTSTFMTDVPAFAAEMACLALGVAAFRHEGRARWVLAAASMAAGCVGFSVREFDLAAPIAVLIVLALQDRRHLRGYGILGASLLLLCAAVYVWTWSMAGAQHDVLGGPTISNLRALLGGYFALALFVSPFLPVAAKRSWPASSSRGLAAAGVILVTGAVLMGTGKSVFSGNYLTPQGMSTTATLPGFRPVLFPTPLWLLLELIGLGAGALLGFIAVDAVAGRTSSLLLTGGRVSERSVITLFTWLGCAGLVIYGLFIQGAIFDRYLWPIVFGTAVLLAAKGAGAPGTAPVHAARAASGAGLTTQASFGPATRTASATRADTATRAATGALALVSAVVALSVMLNADAYDGARWTAGQEAVKAGYTATAVDAGFDWVGGHATTLAVRGRRVAGAPSFETWYDEMFAGFRDCAFVSGSPVAKAHVALLGTVRYHEVGFAVPEDLYIYGVRDRACEVATTPK